MTSETDLFAPEDTGETLLIDLLSRSRKVLVKKLSNNDRDWAQKANKHQAGVYIPPAQRDDGFFPALVTRHRGDEAAEIREVYFRTEWPQVGEEKATRLVHYTSKGAETHMTGLPKAAFSQLSPASWLVMAQKHDAPEPTFICLTISSDSDASALLVDVLDLASDFAVAVLQPAAISALERDRIMGFAEEVAAAWLANDIASFAAGRAAMPATAELAVLARGRFLEGKGLASLDPFGLARPGDAIREISRAIEWELFRDFQRRERAVELVRAVFGDQPAAMDMKTVIRRMVDGVAEIDRIMLSASQQRKSRAGYSFEHHIEAMLEAGSIPFAKQVVIEARKRPDFVLPSLAHLRGELEGPARGLILSAKTTLRERWKQVEREMGASDLYLATVDETIAANAIEDMATMNITLVVPESLKTSRDTEYVRHDNVMDFATFFGRELRDVRMPAWNLC
ncbi:type II restriction endonuclease [Caulobacter sp. ErkDOM-YI]|uniref:type II restriction endonuclease n=1 Tax=unclassified Caulobacter TaxID=2648921 RepID=UPI003AF6E603